MDNTRITPVHNRFIMGVSKCSGRIEMIKIGAI